MIPFLFPASETSFANSGIGALVDCISCTVTEIRDTWEFECEFKYPVNAPMYPKIKVGNIIYVDHDNTKIPQPFDIYAYEVSLDGIATFHAHHVSYRLSNYICVPRINFSVTVYSMLLRCVTGSFSGSHYNKLPYCEGISYGGFNLSPHDLSIDVSNALTWNFPTPISAREMLLGTEGSIFDKSHIEYKWNKFNVSAYGNGRGTDRPIAIRYDYNLTGLEYECDYDNTIYAIIPYWVDHETGRGYTIDELGGVSRGGGTYDDTIITNKDDVEGTAFNAKPVDLTDKFDSQPTGDDLYQAAKTYYSDNNLDTPHENLKINFEWLQDSPEYTQYMDAQELLLCDTCTVVFPEIELYKRMKVIKTVYDPLANGGVGRYTEMEFGSSTRGIFTVTSTSNTPKLENGSTYIELPDIEILPDETDDAWGGETIIDPSDISGDAVEPGDDSGDVIEIEDDP